MPHAAKIATCCYCGTRAALTLRGFERHELACSNCGAPLSELKMLKVETRGERDLVRPSRRRAAGWQRTPKKKKKAKKSRSLSQRFLEEVWDVAEDIFDDIFD